MKKVDNDKAFFGQPRGLSILFSTVMWERFSYYGMRAILLFYMYYAVEQGGLGMSQTLAASIMSIYGALVYISTILGGWLADRVWGARKTTFIGGLLIMLGHICLSLPFGKPALYLSIVFIVLGSGLLNPSASSMVGDLYDKNDNRRDAGFSLFVFGINVGAVLAPVLVPWASTGFGLHLFGNQMNFHAGFSLAAIGMFIGLIHYSFAGHQYLGDESLKPNDPLNEAEKKQAVVRFVVGIIALIIVMVIMQLTHTLNIENVINVITVVAIIMPIVYFVMMLTSDKVTKVEKSRVWAYIPLFIAAAIFWGIEESGSTILALFAANQTRLSIAGFPLQAANFQLLNPLFIMLLTPVFVALWSKWKNQPTSPSKFAWALVFAGLSYAWMAIPVQLFGISAKVSPWWLVGSWFLVEIGEMLNSPIGLSVTTKLAPAAFKSQMMSLWYMADSVGQAVTAQTVKLYKPTTEVNYFLAVGVVSILFGVILFFLSKRIHGLMQGIN
ncbi:MAG: peptide MFS transporter [Lactobacillus sp.]|nr:peptide MFS transporter [Lactobacillus sp.]